MGNITLETIYKKVADLQRDVVQIKKTLLEEPELREDFIFTLPLIPSRQGRGDF
jgi:hypothetical protein